MKIYDKTTQTYKELVLKPGGDTLPIGSIVAFSGENIPNGWLLCDGSVVSRTTYSELFNAIGLNYVEDGVEWLDEERFPLPNAKGKTIVGKDSTDTDFSKLGKTVGEKTHTLTVSEMPKHNHTGGILTTNTIAGNARYYFQQLGATNDENFSNSLKIGEAGGGQAHNNLQPSLTLNFIIKAKNTVAIKGDVIQETGTASETNVYSSVAIDNKIQALKSKNIIVVGYSRHTQSLTSWTNTLITDASVKTQIGNKLTFSNNKVIIGEGVSHIRISAKSSFKKTVTGDCSINVKKNDESITILDTYENVPSNSWHNTAISPSIIEVSQGDEISLNITLGNSGDVEFLAASYITIEEV